MVVYEADGGSVSSPPAATRAQEWPAARPLRSFVNFHVMPETHLARPAAASSPALVGTPDRVSRAGVFVHVGGNECGGSVHHVQALHSEVMRGRDEGVVDAWSTRAARHCEALKREGRARAREARSRAESPAAQRAALSAVRRNTRVNPTPTWIRGYCSAVFYAQ